VSLEDNKALIRNYFAALDANRRNDVADMFSDELQLYFDGYPAMGKTDGFGFLCGFLDAFPGITHEVVDQFAEGDRVATRIIVRGTNTAPMMGMPATGKSVTFGAINIARLADGKIAELHVNADSLGMLQQLGLASAPA
jgi:steroid delta-isomerase-like uncharacterized protein